jgi:hypothetical protein
MSAELCLNRGIKQPEEKDQQNNKTTFIVQGNAPVTGGGEINGWRPLLHRQ